jgi:hypothetical protein
MITNWRVSSFSSDDDTGTCVQVGDMTGGGRAVRHSRRPSEGTLTFTSAEWTAFIAGAKAGEFD